MLKRSSMLALTAAATLGLAALSTTSASALGGHGFGKQFSHNGGQNNGGQAKPASFDHPGNNNFAKFKGWPNKWWHHDHHEWAWHWPHDRWERPVITSDTAYVAARPSVPAGNCNCLTKEYMQDGSVVFKDLCTKESAVASPNDQQADSQPR